MENSNVITLRPNEHKIEPINQVRRAKQISSNRVFSRTALANPDYVTM